MRDSGSIVIGWLTKLALVIAVLGTLAFDGIALVKTNFAAADHAGAAARVAADSYRANKDIQLAYNAAVTSVAGNGETIENKTFSVNPADGRVTLVLHSEAATLWMHRIGPLKKYADVSAKGEGTPAQ